MKKTTLSLSLMFMSSFIFAQLTYLQCGYIIDCESDKIQEKKTIIIEGNTIKEIRDGFVSGGDMDKIIDLKNEYVLPGLMDMHVHIEGQSSPKRYEMGFRMNKRDVALKATQYCERTLMAGFTFVRDLGGSGVNVSLRNAINAGYIKGPRIFTAEKALGTTGGHADPTNGVRDDLKGDPGPKEGVVNSADDIRKAVRQRYKNGADCIKITATGGVLSVAKDGMGPQFSQEELDALVEIANDYGYITAAHAHGKEGMLRAVKAGITTIEHGTFMDQEVMDLMIKKGTYYVPTISAGMFVYEMATKHPNYFPAIIRPKAIAIGPQSSKTFGKAYKAGVKIAFGTDSGVSPHGDNAKEFQYMVEAGMPPMEAILSATKITATLVSMEDKLGTITVGKLADIIAVEHNPIEDIKALQEVKFVMKDGVIYKE